MDKIEAEYQRLLKVASELPEGKLWKAYTVRTNELVGPMRMTRDYSWRTFKCPIKAMKKAKRMAEWRDRATRGENDGVSYGIEPLEG